MDNRWSDTILSSCLIPKNKIYVSYIELISHVGHKIYFKDIKLIFFISVEVTGIKLLIKGQLTCNTTLTTKFVEKYNNCILS